MKTKFFLTAIAMMVLSTITTASAKDDNFNKNEVMVGAYGGARGYDMNDFGVYAQKFVDSDDHLLLDGGVNFQYMRNLGRRFGIGAEVNFGRSSAGIYNQGFEVGSLRQKNGSILADTRFYWINIEHFSLYSKLAFGVKAVDRYVSVDNREMHLRNVTNMDLEGDSETSFDFKVSPVGVDFGGEHVRGFVETNIAPANFTVTGGVKFIY